MSYLDVDLKYHDEKGTASTAVNFRVALTIGAGNSNSFQYALLHSLLGKAFGNGVVVERAGQSPAF